MRGFTISSLICFTLFQGLTSVRRPDYLMSEYSRARVATEENTDSHRPKDTHSFYGSAVRKVYISDDYKQPPIKATVSSAPAMTATKCCKLGERVAKEGMHCLFEVHTASSTLNYANGAKLRLHRQHALKSVGIEKSANYKNLVTKVARCDNFVSKFEKCCNYRTSFMRSMKRCRDLIGPERRQCRTKTRKSFGYTH